jgi:hypothetical protein
MRPNRTIRLTAKPKDKERSSKWPALRKQFLQGKSCAVCGSTKKLEAHHKEPFHLFPERELDPLNLIALCESRKDLNCHLVFGHLGDFKSYNPSVVTDSATWHKKFDNKPKTCPEPT